MNKARRKQLNALQDRITELKEKIEGVLADITEMVSDIRDDLETIKDEEQEAFNNLSEGFQAGEKGDAMTGAIHNMDTAHGTLDELAGSLDVEHLLSELDSAFEEIENAKGA